MANDRSKMYKLVNNIRMYFLGYNENEYDQQYKIEYELINGIHSNKNNHVSIIHFSLNKAATQYTKSILNICATENGIIPVGIHDYAFNTNFPFLDKLSAKEMEQYKHIFRKNGYLYSVFGGMIDGIPELEQYKVVLGVRDPRDLLTSEYYSTAYSHPEPSSAGDKYETFMKNRTSARASTIDQYVINVSNRLNNTLNRYIDLLLLPYPDVYVIKYENMITDFEAWLAGLLHYCELKVSDSTIDNIIAENRRLKPNMEDVNKHIRKGQAGDHKDKLKPETIKRLNETFSRSLDYFGYEK